MNCERNICYQQEYNGGCDTCPCNRTADESSEVEITTQEAMETLKFLLSIERHHKEPLRMAIEALEKQVPKKPIKKKVATLNKTPNAFSWESTRCCPRCKSNLVVKIFGKHLEDYCPLCGQRLDWSDEG